ncbi:hypothetical protein LJC08_06290 [Methanimicrococcus sp. OttesenSCG-928-J09]|nr:hypothetical protein [Methanimicrococcus sp. OttesenSCG-928-J09]
MESGDSFRLESGDSFRLESGCRFAVGGQFALKNRLRDFCGCRRSNIISPSRRTREPHHF